MNRYRIRDLWLEGEEAAGVKFTPQALEQLRRKAQGAKVSLGAMPPETQGVPPGKMVGVLCRDEEGWYIDLKEGIDPLGRKPALDIATISRELPDGTYEVEQVLGDVRMFLEVSERGVGSIFKGEEC